MRQTLQDTMRAAALDRFGGLDLLHPATLPVPAVGEDEILVHVESAGVGVWDPYEREGEFAKIFGIEPRFPYVLGSDGAGTVVAVGDRVSRFKEGDRVFAMALANPKGGFYAEFCAVKEEHAAKVPDGLPTEQAGALAVCAVTALRGLDDALSLRPGESVLVLGASGGVGHLALQLAKRMGARVLAVASGADGVALCRRLGADAAVDGREDDPAEAAKAFAPDGLDAALLLAGGEAGERAIAALREGGRAAYPHGVEPEPEGAEGYDGTPDAEVLDKLCRLIEAGPFEVHVARTFPLDRAADAHRALDEHFLGKYILKPS